MSTIIPDLHYASSPSQPSFPTPSHEAGGFKKIFDETPRQKEVERRPRSPWEPVAPLSELNDEEEPENLEGIAPPPSMTIHTLPSSATEALRACPPPVHALFEEVLEKIQVVHNDGDTHVSFFFTSTSPKHALLAGTRITIREFSTAPKVFNIEIATLSTTAQQLIQAHGASLLQAFHQGSFPFSVERLDIEFETQSESQEDSSASEEDSTP